MVQPAGLSNRTPSLRVMWPRQQFGVTGEELARTLFSTDPRIALFPAGGAGDPSVTGVSITPYMLSPGEERIVADRLHALLSSRSPRDAGAPRAAPVADLTGQWDVRIEYAAGVSTHAFHLRQRGREIDGAHQGDFVSRNLSGSLDGDAVRIQSAYGEQHGDALSFTFSGSVVSGDKDEMTGTLDMGEYLGARWTAKRRVASRG